MRGAVIVPLVIEGGGRAAQAVPGDLGLGAVGVEDAEADPAGGRSSTEMKSRPSAPAPVWRSQSLRTRSAVPSSGAAFRRMTRKSLPREWALVIFIQDTFSVTIESWDWPSPSRRTRRMTASPDGVFFRMLLEFADGGHLLPVDLEDDVAGREPRPGGLAVVPDLGDEEPLDRPVAVAAGQGGGQGVTDRPRSFSELAASPFSSSGRAPRRSA